MYSGTIIIECAKMAHNFSYLVNKIKHISYQCCVNSVYKESSLSSRNSLGYIIHVFSKLLTPRKKIPLHTISEQPFILHEV